MEATRDNAVALTVSVLLCTYNGAKYIREQLDSIRRQSYPLLEVLAFDDCSTDGTLDVLNAYAAEWPLLKVQRNPQNFGFNRNFEQALRAGKGDVLAISDQDDIWLPEKIGRLIAAWDPKCPVVYCESMSFEGEPPTTLARTNPDVLFQGRDSRKLIFRNSVPGHAMLLRRSFVDMVLPIPPGVFYDWWAAFLAAENGGVCLVDELLVLHRRHTNNASGKRLNTRATLLAHYREEIYKQAAAFQNAQAVPERVRKLARDFREHLQRREEQGGRWKLFLLILKNLELFFYFRPRKAFNKIHLTKHAWYYAFVG